MSKKKTHNEVITPDQIIKNPAPKQINIDKLDKNDQEIVLQSNLGVRTKDIAKSLKMHPNSVSRRKSTLSKYLISYDVKFAKKCKKLRHLIMDQALLDNSNLKLVQIAQDYDKMQLDRIDPVRTVNESTSLNVNVSVMTLPGEYG